MNEIDFRIIKPIKRFNKYLGADDFIIPCKVVEIDRNEIGNKHQIKIEIVNFLTGKLIIVSATSYVKTIKIFDEFNLELPFKTQCSIVKKGNDFDLIVYGMFNVDLMENFANYGEDGFLTEEQIMEVFEEFYKEIREWVKIKK